MGSDKGNHLYALNGVSGRLHVYTATSTSVVEAPGPPLETFRFVRLGPFATVVLPDDYSSQRSLSKIQMNCFLKSRTACE
jgi:hypothetical protein